MNDLKCHPFFQEHEINARYPLMEEAQRFMQRALELAVKGHRQVAPNPLVGAVVVHEGKIIGEGYHQRFGGPHAEVLAINSVSDRSLLAASTLYVTLEPCCHFGKTPPCTDLILEHRIPRVVIATRDPFPSVSGNGIEVLKSAGIDVSLGVCEKQARWVNRRFFSLYEQRRPYVILKWAETKDGFIASSDYSSKWISGESSRARVHEWRAEEAAIMVGPRTALVDNPLLTARPEKQAEETQTPPRQPLRVVLDPKGKLPRSSNVFNDAAETLVITRSKERRDKLPPHLTFEEIDWSQKVPAQVLGQLASRRILSVLIEGGAHTLQEFIDAGLWDEARIFTSQSSFEDGVKAPLLNGIEHAREAIGEDSLRIIVNESNLYA